MFYRIALSESFVHRYAPHIYQYQQQQVTSHRQQQQQQAETAENNVDQHATTIENHNNTHTAIEHQPAAQLEHHVEQSSQKFISHEQLIDQLAASIGQGLQEKYEEELVALKKQNLELKYQNGQVLNHLQDGRQVHIEKEVEALMAVIPQRSASMVYKCQSHNDALKQCYQTHLNAQKTAKLPEDHVIQLDLLKCRPFVSEFVECAQGTRREFLANNDL